MENIKYIYQNFSKILPLFTVFLIAVGYVDLKTQYLFFNIKIENYITATEILIKSVEKIFGLTLAVVIVALAMVFLKKQFPAKTGLAIFIGSCIVGVLIYCIDLFYGNEDFGLVRYVNIGITTLAVFLLANWLTDEFPDQETVAGNSGEIEQWWWVGKFGFTLLGFIFLINTSRAINLIFSRHEYSAIEFILENGSSVTTSKTTVYIGKTQDYFFFYDREQSRTYIYAASKVVKIKKELKLKSFREAIQL